MNKIDEEICRKKEIKANLYVEKFGEDDITRNTFFKNRFCYTGSKVFGCRA